MSVLLANFAEEMKKAYDEDTRNGSYNAILYGDLGTGKTEALRTVRRPLLVDSFDPGGTKTLRIDPGFGKDIIVRTQFEKESPRNPSAYAAWEKAYTQAKRDKIFEQIGTYAIDSATTWSNCLMNHVLKTSGNKRAHAQVPGQQDYLLQMAAMKEAIIDLVSLPCDVVLIAHVDYDKDEELGTTQGVPMLTGKLKRQIPLLFDEIYYAVTKRSSSGIDYKFMTANSGTHMARTRLGAGGKLELFEGPNFKAILKKVGANYEDLKATEG